MPKLVPNVSQRCTPVFIGVPASEGNSGPAPVISSANLLSSSVDSARFRVGTLSHFLGKKASDYEELPDWPEVQPDPSVRKSKVPEKPVMSAAAGPAAIAAIAKAKIGLGVASGKKNGFLR